MKKFNLILGIIAMICFAFGFSACEKDADFQKQENTLESIQSAADDFSVEIYKLEDGDSLNTRALFYNTSSWGGYTFLDDTGNHAEYFPTGTYAVRIKRNWLSPSTLSISVTAQNQGNNYSATTWAYKFDANDTEIYASNAQVFDTGQPAYWDISITGNESMVFKLTITTADNYIFWYRKV